LVKTINSLTGFFDRDLLFYLKTMQKFIDAAGQPPSERFEAMKTFDEDMVEAKRKLYVMTALILPALGKTMDRDAENSARLRTAATALAIERYRLKHDGKLPETFSVLVPEYLPTMPIDPFTGEAMQYRKRDKGFVVYSAGADRQDDGGVTTAKKRGASGASPADICFTVER
jgi:type II secretory pathway pseudopilin PulG